MKERSIRFTGPEVCAILEGRKTQTRRLCSVQPESEHDIVEKPVRWVKDGRWFVATVECDWWFGHCPYGVPGARLWVRETWLELDSDHRQDVTRPAGERMGNYMNGIAYRADTDDEGDAIRQEYGYKWRPSIHMPRRASRIDLEVTGVRVERLQEISEEDALAEGCWPCKMGTGSETPAELFANLWESINNKRAPWSSNPWVWVVEFRRIRP